VVNCPRYFSIKNIKKHFTLSNIIVGIIGLSVGCLFKFTGLSAGILNFFNLDPSLLNKYILSGFIVLVTRLGIKGMVEAYFEEIVIAKPLTMGISSHLNPKPLTMDIKSHLNPKPLAMDINRLLNPTTPPSNSGGSGSGAGAGGGGGAGGGAGIGSSNQNAGGSNPVQPQQNVQPQQDVDLIDRETR